MVGHDSPKKNLIFYRVINYLAIVKAIVTQKQDRHLPGPFSDLNILTQEMNKVRFTAMPKFLVYNSMSKYCHWK